jgi:thiol:disulfide interchange protein DsbA
MCTHCNDFEPYVTNWKKRQADNIEFVRYPVIFGRSSWELYARAYVTASIMGIADQAHGPLMEKLWKEKSILKSMDELANFYAGFGAEPAEFVATSKSFAVDAKLRKEQRDMQLAEIRGTPSLIVNDKYVIAAGAAVGSFQQLLEVADFLIVKELSAHAAANKSAETAPPAEATATAEGAAAAETTTAEN